MGYAIEASSGPVAGVLTRPRPCRLVTVYGAAAEALLLFERRATTGIVRVSAGPGKPYALVEYYGGRTAIATYYTHRDQGSRARRDTVDMGTHAVLASRVRPMLGGGWVGGVA